MEGEQMTTSGHNVGLEEEKPMNDTSRTDAARHDEHDPFMAIAAECLKLEHELNAANRRIKRLEEGGDNAVLILYYPDRLAVWNQAKKETL